MTNEENKPRIVEEQGKLLENHAFVMDIVEIQALRSVLDATQQAKAVYDQALSNQARIAREIIGHHVDAPGDFDLRIVNLEAGEVVARPLPQVPGQL